MPPTTTPATHRQDVLSLVDRLRQAADMLETADDVGIAQDVADVAEAVAAEIRQRFV